MAQTAPDVQAANATRTLPGASARDGFTLRGTEVVMTRSGVTTKVEREMAFPNGLKVQANGTIMLRDGTSVTLRPNQLLTFDGEVQEVALSADGVAPVSSVDTGPVPQSGSTPTMHDGITMVGADVFITRNGVREKVNADVRLPNGVVAQSDGTVVLNNGNRITLRPNQVLGLDGVLRESAAPAASSTTLPPVRQQ